MKKIILLLVIMVTLSGCAKTWDAADANGGLFTSSKAPYIIVNQSGGIIMDVYKLNNAVVQSPTGSDGWLVKDNDGAPIYLGGDVKTIRLKTIHDKRWKKYHEYHMEFEKKTYREVYNK
jgi:hypothetical protein|tara:strand:- start:6650 stop:7006 length:357 start_codon:yes stop_codon:yes gene_type:complete